jgi:hypothetical protein
MRRGDRGRTTVAANATIQHDILDRVYIAKPCTADWNSMPGDARVRACELCQLNVYNLSEMTRPAAVALIEKNEGKICAMYYKRADGTILTKDCPMGVRAYTKKLVLAGAAVLVSLVAFGSGAAGRSRASNSTNPSSGSAAASAFPKIDFEFSRDTKDLLINYLPAWMIPPSWIVKKPAVISAPAGPGGMVVSSGPYSPPPGPSVPILLGTR